MCCFLRSRLARSGSAENLRINEKEGEEKKKTKGPKGGAAHIRSHAQSVSFGHADRVPAAYE